MSTKGEKAKRFPRRDTKNGEGPLRGWWGIERGSPKVGKGEEDIHEGRKGKKISTEGSEKNRDGG